jgi:hypothetical protein
MCNIKILMMTLVLIIILFFWFVPQIEMYGGPIKQVRKIPKSTGYNICMQHYQKCMSDYKNVPGSGHFCERNYNSCIAELHYSDSHRL